MTEQEAWKIGDVVRGEKRRRGGQGGKKRDDGRVGQNRSGRGIYGEL